MAARALVSAGRPVPDWLRAAAGALGPKLTALRPASGHLELEVDGGALGPLLLAIHAPGAPDLPFACPAFAVGYRVRPGVSQPVAGEVCRRFGRAIAAVPGAGERLLALAGSAPITSREAGSMDAIVADAMTRLAKGDVVGAMATWRTARDGAARMAAQAQALFSCVEGRELRGEIPPSPPPAEPASPAWALAWAGALGEARRLAEAQPSGPEAWGLLGVLAVLERRPAAALPLLDRSLAHGGGEELLLHRARALLHLGRHAEAERTLMRIIERESFGQRVLKALVVVRRGLLLPTFGRWCRRVAASDYHFNGLFSTELPALFGRPTLHRAFASRAALIDLLEGLLDRMAGNLGPSPTFAEVTPGGPRFVRAAIPPPPRVPAIEALHSLRYVGALGAEAALTELLARRPRSVHAHTHRGELYLWLGRYDDAWQDFVAARRIEPVRWADIGMLAVLTLTGRLRSARLLSFYAEHHFTSTIPGGTLPVYRGMLRRRLGDIDGAIADLRAALAVKPTRLGARMELCLALRAAGLTAAASQHAEVLLREAAPLLVDAADAIALDWRAEAARLVEDAVLEEALRSMRGNRSSGLVTWIDRAGSLRVLTPLGELEERAAQTLSGG